MVILGGGFAGLYAARALADAPVDITLIDRRNHHLFQPLLYQVATAALNPANIAIPIRGILRKNRNVRVFLAEAEAVDVERQRVILKDGIIDYDDLIIATGATHSYFGNDHWAKHAPGLKSLDDALEIRRRVFLAYEAAEREDDPARVRAWLTFVIVGAGPTGVELAGALAEISRKAMKTDFRKIDPADARIVLVEGLDRVLPGYPAALSAKARTQVEHLGVEVRTNARVTSLDAGGVIIGGERLPTRTTIWAAGVQASPLARSLGAPLDRAGRVMVTPHLTLPGHDEVTIVGDLAHVEQDGATVPGVAPAAIQQGRHAAANLRRRLKGEAPLPFRYLDKGAFAVIGRRAAVGSVFGKLNLSGVVAWLGWLFVHIAYLIGFRNRFLVLAEWGFEYATFRRGARLITGEYLPPLPPLIEAASLHEPGLPPPTDGRDLTGGEHGTPAPI